MRARWLALGVMVVALGCDGDAATDGGSVDGGSFDGGGADGGSVDGGGVDGGGVDGGGVDGGTGTDAGMGTDAGTACGEGLPRLSAETVAIGLQQPVYVTQPPGVTDALYAVEKWGRIIIVRGGVAAGTFLDLTPVVARSGCAGGPCVPSFGDERGLLGLAFHPDYAANGRFFVYFAPLGGTGRNVVQELRRSAADPERADPTPVRTLIDVVDPESNHNGGMLAFGPDGYLYVAMGDGGGGCDSHGASGNGQNLGSAFGKIHRLDVDAAAPHAASGNPFTGAGQLSTIWAYGLRNPWRFSFDRDMGDLFIGDVGQDAYEEIDFAPRSSAGGENYGWRQAEGLCSSNNSLSRCTSSIARETCLTPEQHQAMGFTPPIFVAPHESRAADVLSLPCSIVGGYVYRGSAIPALRGFYLFGDSCSDSRAALSVCGPTVRAQRIDDLEGVPAGLVSFGEDNAGELYMVGLTGTIVRVVAR